MLRSYVAMATSEEAAKVRTLFEQFMVDREADAAGAAAAAAEKEANAEKKGKALGKDFVKDAEKFDGSSADYNDWAWGWKASVHGESTKFSEMLENLEMLEDEVEMDIAALNFPENKGYEAEKWDGELYNVLSKKLKGSALVTLQDTESMSG